MSKNTCHACNAELAANAVYCSKCGADIDPGSKAFFCIRCGKALVDGATGCSYCLEPVPYALKGKNEEYTRLVERAINGEVDAFQALYEQRFNDLYYIALQMLRNPHDAEDATQSAFMQAWASIGTLKSPHAFKGWLTRILSNKCMDLIRSKKPVLSESEDFSFEETLYEENIEFLPADIMDKKETQRLVREIVDGLPDNQRQTIVLHYFDLLPIIEIADIMSVSEGTVKSRLHYGRLAVKDGVEKHEKQGVKLYSVAGLPLLYLILRDGAAQAALSPEVISGLWQSLSAGLGAGAAAGAGVGVAAATEGAAAAAAVGAGAATVKTAGIIGAIASATITAKVAAAIITVLAVGGGIAAGVILSKPNDTDVDDRQPAAISVATPTAEQINARADDAVAEPSIEPDDDNTAEPEIETDDEPDLAVDPEADEEETAAETEVEASAEPEEEHADEPGIEPDIEQNDEQTTVPEIEQDDEIGNETDAGHTDQAVPEPIAEPEEEPEEEPAEQQPEDGNYYVILSVGESFMFTNVSSSLVSVYREYRSWGVGAGIPRNSDYAMYDKDGNATHISSSHDSISSSGRYRFDLEPGSRLIFTHHSSTVPITLYFDAELLGSAITVEETSAKAIHYVSFTGSSTITFENQSPSGISIHNANRGVKTDYTIYNSTASGRDTVRTNHNNQYRYDLITGARLVLSLVDPSDTITFWFAAELLNRGVTVRID